MYRYKYKQVYFNNKRDMELIIGRYDRKYRNILVTQIDNVGCPC